MANAIDWRAIVAGLAIAGSATALGAAVDTRDQTKANTAELRRVEDVQAERDKHILEQLAAISADLKDLKAKAHP